MNHDNDIESIIPQSTLFEGPKILDATCSFAKIWPKHATVRIDIRPECKPDIVMDATDLKFPENYFDEIYCDPPHWMRNSNDLTRIKIVRRLSGRKTPDSFTRYGFWKSEEEWFRFIEGTNKEFHRCLKPMGVLYYKITEAGRCGSPKDLIERMTNFTLIEDRTNPSKSNLPSKGTTHWLTFKSKKIL